MCQLGISPSIDLVSLVDLCTTLFNHCRPERVLETFDTVYKSRVPPNVASKTADIYPIENVWSILKAEAQQHAPIKDIETLKRILNRKWRHISNDRNLCSSMIASIPNRITAMIEKGGA